MLSDRTDGAMSRRILALAWPTVLYSLLELSLGVADLVMVRGLGFEATAAMGLTRQIAFLVEASALAIATGVIALVSQGVGAGDRSQVHIKACVWQSCWGCRLRSAATW